MCKLDKILDFIFCLCSFVKMNIYKQTATVAEEVTPVIKNCKKPSVGIRYLTKTVIANVMIAILIDGYTAFEKKYGISKESTVFFKE